MKSDSPFSYSNFFDSPGFFKEFLERYENVWESLFHVENFINEFSKHAQQYGYDQIKDGVFVGKNVVIDKTAEILGKAIIGDNVTIGHAAFLRGDVLLSENVHVGHATEVKHSIILSNTALAHLNYIGDSIVGSGCNISGGATLANWRFDKREIEVKHNGERIPTGMDKFGGVVGDNCFIGVSAVLNPGTILGKNSLVYPLVSVTGTHPENSTIK